MVKGSIYLGLQIHETRCSNYKIKNRVKNIFYQDEWWHNFMQMDKETLDSFCEDVLNYYAETDKL